MYDGCSHLFLHDRIKSFEGTYCLCLNAEQQFCLSFPYFLLSNSLSFYIKCTGCPNKSARFNFVIKRTIYSKSADVFISVQSTHTAINCGRQYPTNFPHDSADTLLHFWRNSRWHFSIIAALFRQWHVESPPWTQELFVVCWHRHEISQPPKERSRTLSNRTNSVANADRHCVRWHGNLPFVMRFHNNNTLFFSVASHDF